MSGAPTLVDKAEAVRGQLGIKPGLNLPEIAAEAVDRLGLPWARELPLIDKIAACHKALFGETSPQDVTLTVVAGQVVTGEPVLAGGATAPVEATAEPIGYPPIAAAPPVAYQAPAPPAEPIRPVSAQPARFATPPRAHDPRDGFGGMHNDMYFFKYRMEHGPASTEETCCQSHPIVCGACAHGEVTEWASGRNKGLDYFLCGWLFGPCMIEEARRDIEAKIHMFHRERGDPLAQGPPHRHEGTCICAYCCFGIVWWGIMAENLAVKRQFQRVQGPYGAH